MQNSQPQYTIVSDEVAQSENINNNNKNNYSQNNIIEGKPVNYPNQMYVPVQQQVQQQYVPNNVVQQYPQMQISYPLMNQVQVPQQQPIPQKQVFQQQSILNPNQLNPNIQQQPQLIYPAIPAQQIQLQQLNQNQTGILIPIQVPKNPTSRYSQTLYCEQCKRPVESQISYKIGVGTCLMGAGIALCGLVYGCCLIPCFINNCKDVYHHCPSCPAESNELGKVRFLLD